MPSTFIEFEFEDNKYSQISGNFGAFGPCPGRIWSYPVILFAFPPLILSVESPSFFVVLENKACGGKLIFPLLSLFSCRPTILKEEATNGGGDTIVVVILVALKSRSVYLLRDDKRQVVCDKESGEK